MGSLVFFNDSHHRQKKGRKESPERRGLLVQKYRLSGISALAAGPVDRIARLRSGTEATGEDEQGASAITVECFALEQGRSGRDIEKVGRRFICGNGSAPGGQRLATNVSMSFEQVDHGTVRLPGKVGHDVSCCVTDPTEDVSGWHGVIPRLEMSHE